MPTKTKTAAKTYDASSIKQLKGLEAVRERPGMYLGDPTSGDALHHLVWEAVDNAVDEHLAGHGKVVTIELLEDGWCTVEDEGRGIPVDMHKEAGIPALQLILTTLHSGGKFDRDSYEGGSAGLHGIGIAAVNAVSAHLIATVTRGGYCWQQAYAQGAAVTEIERSGKGKVTNTGTKIAWQRDLTIFSDVIEYDRDRIAKRMQELAFLNPALILVLNDRRTKKAWSRTFSYPGGAADYLEEITKRGVTPILHFVTPSCVLALRWTSGESEDVRCYANNTFNSDGGTHAVGFRNGLTRAITAYAKDNNMLRGLGEEGITGGDIREGLVAIVSVRLKETSFSSQTKDKLVTAGARGLVEDMFKDEFSPYLEANPGIAQKIALRAVQAAKMREAARKARENVKRVELLDPLSLPGKLADCQSRNRDETELVICEGESAGGSAKLGRDRRIQAILPLRGKILNTERADAETIVHNAELAIMIGALGCGIEQNRTFDINKLRYGKVIIMTDADVDGAHIRTLLLTFFYRCMPQLIWDGHLYVAQPPLYAVSLPGQSRRWYFTTEPEYLRWRATLHATAKPQLTRYKGLGEMNPEVLWATTMDPQTRDMKIVTIQDAVLADRAFTLLMGSDVERRRDWIEEQSGGNFDPNTLDV